MAPISRVFCARFLFARVATSDKERNVALACNNQVEGFGLSTFAGNRTVPVEIGEHYLAPGWKQELMTIGELLDAAMHRLGHLQPGFISHSMPSLTRMAESRVKAGHQSP